MRMVLLLPSLPLGERGRGSEGFAGQIRPKSPDPLNHAYGVTGIRNS